jgi:cell wall-associated NlpC family hydrolase
VNSTNLFIDRLLANKNWDTQDPWLSAQSVQDSAWDGVPRPENNFSAEVGGNYKAQLPSATRILETIKHDSANLTCDGTGGSGIGVTPSGLLDAHGLPVSFVIPNDGTIEGRLAVVAALTALGRPYVFGAVGPNAFDCSGLTQWAWARAGVNLPHYTVDQWHAGTATAASSLVPGDLVLTPGADGTLSNPQHVGMFIGQGLVVEAPQTGDVVKVVTYASFVSAGISGLRHIG